MTRISKWAPALLLMSLTACADNPNPAPVPVIVERTPAPIASECNPKTRARVPAIKKVAGDKTPLGNLENTLIDAGTADAKNRIRETRCYCAQLGDRGSAAEKAAGAKMCGPQS